MIDEKKARWMRGIVGTVFIACFAAFLLATIRHLEVFFNGFEQGGDTFGSYMLAGAFDLTDLIITIAVMFFRKSMPKKVQFIVWGFIIAIALYSGFINWEYTAHFQSASLILQPTGHFIPTYDAQGVLHYVPEMKANTTLLWINPFLASGFTILAIIYSIIAEFFGTKPPSVEELKARKSYLEETSTLTKDIAKLEGKDEKKESLLERGLKAAKQVKNMVDEMRADAQKASDSGTANTPAPEQQNGGQQPAKNETITSPAGTAKPGDAEQENEGETAPNNIRSLPVAGGPSMTIAEAAARLGVTEKHVGTLLKNKRLQHTPRNTKLVLTSSVEQYEAARAKKQETAQQKKSESANPSARKNNVKKTPKPDFASLGLIERKMYEVLTEHPQEFEELLRYADDHTVEELVGLLQERYASHAGFITTSRVSKVLAYARAERGQTQVAEGERIIA